MTLRAPKTFFCSSGRVAVREHTPHGGGSRNGASHGGRTEQRQVGDSGMFRELHMDVKPEAFGVGIDIMVEQWLGVFFGHQ